jgi:hypothetical protein
MSYPTKRILSILNRELVLSMNAETKAVLSDIINQVKTNIVPLENEKMAELFDTGFSMGCDYALNDRGNISGKEWIAKQKSKQVILCEICDSEVIPNCEYEDCPNK